MDLAWLSDKNNHLLSISKLQTIYLIMHQYTGLIGGLLSGILFIIQVGLMTFWRGSPPASHANEMGFFATGIFISVFPLLWMPMMRGKNDITTPPGHSLTMLLLIVHMLGIILCEPGLNAAFERYPISITQSDIIPQIEIMVRTFFWEGETPYQTITDFGYPLFSPYMPLHWGPFVISEWAQFDHRWVAVAVFVVTSGYFVVKVGNSRIYYPAKLILTLLPAFFLYYLAHEEPQTLGHTVELLIVAYYLLLALSVLSKSPYLRAFAIVLCLLSRYSLVLWLPLFGWLGWKMEGPKHALTVMGLTALGVLILYVFPFWIQDPTIFGQGLTHHAQVSQKAWSFEPWFTPEGRPGVLSWGVGLGRLFFDMGPGEPVDRLKLITLAQLVSSISLVALMGILYRFVQSRIDYKLYLLVSLQLYLLFFYHLYALPFIYYMMVPVIVTMVGVFAVFNLREYLVTSDTHNA